ncbi:hypothetical protein F5Y13DRAFT_185321 [Hypoxylon sp. FL1857]|nr:hypothetical protein F5Y13DRAFT_185321 [Hypoxylon sp. FL1857]
MCLSIVISMAFATVLHAMAIPLSLNQASRNETLGPISPYNCEGSIMCSTIKVQWCDEGVNWELDRSDEINYGAAGSDKPHAGVCHGIGTDYGCAIIIQGDHHCIRSGNDIWWDYQDIRKSGCHHCGHKHWGNGCMTTIDFYPECDWVH